jgi:hypothetical protein
VRNSEPAVGRAVGWVALHDGSMDTAAIPATATADLSNHLRLRGEHTVYEGAKIWIEGFGYAVARRVRGDTLYLNVDVPLRRSGIRIHFSSHAVDARFATAGIIGVHQAPAQEDSTAADLAGMVADFNALLKRLRGAGLMTDP